MHASIEMMPDTPAVYLRRTGPYGGDNRELMEQLKDWARRQGVLENGVILGIAWDNPAKTPLEHCRYDVCLLLESACPELDAGMALERLPRGTYACYRGPHTQAGVQSL